MNSKRSSFTLASQAAKALSSKETSATQKSLAASVLSQRNPHNQTGAAMVALVERGLQRFNLVAVQFGNEMCQMVQLVQVFILGEIIV